MSETHLSVSAIELAGVRSLMRPPILEGKMLVDARSFPI